MTPVLIVLLVILFILITLAVAGFTFSKLYTDKTFRPYTIEKDSSVAHFDWYERKGHYTRRIVRFPSGQNMLEGQIYGEENTRALVVFCHGIWSGPEEYLMPVTYLVDRGYRVFCFSYTSYGNSEGTWAKGLPQSPRDLDAALSYIRTEPSLQKLPLFLMGHSWGAYAVTAVMNMQHSEVRGLVALSGFNDPLEMTLDVASKVVGRGGAALLKPWLILLNRNSFGRDWRLTAVDGLNASGVPALIVHGTADDFIGYETCSIIAKRDRITDPGAEYLTLPGKNHNNYFGDEETAAYQEEIAKGYRALSAKYKGRVPAAERHRYYSTVDLERANRPNTALYDQFDAFYQKVLNETKETGVVYSREES